MSYESTRFSVKGPISHFLTKQTADTNTNVFNHHFVISVKISDY